MQNTFRRWLGSRFFSSFGKQIQETAIAWQIFKLTQDPFALGMLGLAEAIPFIGIALWAGHIVDRNEKRKFIVRAQTGLVLSSAALILMTYLSRPPVILFYSITGWVGLCTSFENISTSAYGQLLIPKEKYPKAMGWSLGLFQMAAISGPILAGWSLARLDVRFIFMGGGILLLTALIFSSLLRPMDVKTVVQGEESGLTRVKLGLKFIWSQPMILSAMSLDMVAVLFGDVVALYPFFAARLNAGSLGFGFLKAAPGVGSALISAVQASKQFVKTSWTSLRMAVLVFGTCIICFALSPNIYWAVFFLVIGGAADGVSVIIRQTTYQALTPDHLRGRVASVSSMFIWTSNEIGAFESGVVARLIGVVPSALVGGAICLGSVFVMTQVFRKKIDS